MKGYSVEKYQELLISQMPVESSPTVLKIRGILTLHLNADKYIDKMEIDWQAS